MNDTERWHCGERITLNSLSGRSRIVAACVQQPGHDPSVAHRSGTDPVICWRTNPQDASVIDVWVEPWRDLWGRPAHPDLPAVTLP